jgi:hypothetical protein
MKRVCGHQQAAIPLDTLNHLLRHRSASGTVRSALDIADQSISLFVRARDRTLKALRRAANHAEIEP